MKKVLALLALTTVFVSCSDDYATSPTETQFFNLAEGNEWVYKRYGQNSPMGEYNFNGRVDSVKVTGQQNLEGQNYFVLNHRIYTNDIFNEERNEYLRVNQDGHLVDNNGLVRHPGTDLEYQYSSIFNILGDPVGETVYHNSAVQEISVEGNIYNVYAFSGYFTPYYDLVEGIGYVMTYQQGVGMVTEKNRYLGAELFFEDRLVYYEVNY